MPHYPQGVIQDPYQRRLTTDENRQGIRVIQVWLWATPSRKIIQRLMSQVSFMITCSLRGLFLPQPDVIFIENQPIFTGLAGWIISRIKRRPYLINVSDYWPEYLLAVGVLQEQSRLYNIFKTLVNRTQRDASAIVALLPGLMDSIQARIGAIENGHVIMNAVDLERFRPDIDTLQFRKKYGLEGKKLLTFVGTLGNHIDLDTMLDVAAYFEDRDDVLTVFIGTGIHREILHERGQDLHQTRWIGWIDHSEMPSAWAASYLTFWAVHENELNKISFQSKLYEAMASGVPPIVSVEGIISDLLDQHQLGITVSFGDKAALINAIEHVLNNPSVRDQMSRNARAYAIANFSPEQVADQYEAVLTDLAQSIARNTRGSTTQ